MAAKNVESAPTTEQTLRERYQISDEPEGLEPEGSELAPESDPEPPQDRKPLTDEEKADRKRRNDERRERRWYEERGEMRAEQRRLQERIAELENSRTRETPETRTATDDDFDFEAKLETNLKSGKFKTYEAALAATTKEERQFLREQIRSEMREETTVRTGEQQLRETRSTFDRDVKEFSKTHDDFDDVYADLASALDTRDKSGKPIGNAATRAILTSKNGAALAYHIGSNPELLEEIQGLLADGDEEAARDRVIEIRATLKKAAPPAQPQERTTSSAGRGRSSTRIGARGGGGSSKTDLQKGAVEKGDFAAFSAANGSKRNW